jgi:hypothetical protein
VMLAFYILYRGERVNNKEWFVKSAERIDPSGAKGAEGIVKFIGLPSGDFVKDDMTGEQFVYVRKLNYQYEKVEKTSSEEVLKGGKTEHITRKYFESEWVYKDRKTDRSGQFKIGEILIRLEEAEIMGDDLYKKTVYVTNAGKSENPPEEPRIGDRKILINGITAKMPVLAAGYLQGGILGSGKVFIVSAYTEGRTLEELHETKWIRAMFCLFMFCAGFILLIHPAKYMLKKHEDYPVIKTLSKMGWGLLIVISIVLSFIIVTYSYVTVDIIWVILICMIILPILNILRKR